MTKTRLISLMIWVVFVYLALIASLYFAQRSMMYFPPRDLSESRLSSLRDFTKILVQTSDGLTISGYFKAPSSPEKPIVLMFHGNAGHPADLVYKIAPHVKDGYGALLAEYRGYGGNPGKVSEQGLYNDGRAYVGWLAKERPANPVILYGESLGSGVAVQMATETKAVALVLDVPFDSALNVARGHYPFVPFMSLIMKDQYRSDEKITKVSIPVLFLLAERDKVVPSRFGQRLFDLASEPKRLVVLQGAEHVTIFDHGADKALADFLKEFVEKP